MDEEQRSQAAVKWKQQKTVCDKNAALGPPDKRHHFEDSDSEELPRSKK